MKKTLVGKREINSEFLSDGADNLFLFTKPPKIKKLKKLTHQ